MTPERSLHIEKRSGTEAEIAKFFGKEHVTVACLVGVVEKEESPKLFIWDSEISSRDVEKSMRISPETARYGICTVAKGKRMGLSILTPLPGAEQKNSVLKDIQEFNAAKSNGVVWVFPVMK